MKTRFLFLMAVCLFAVTTAFGQTRTVKGQVVSATDGEGLLGATIQEVGNLTNGTTTDMNGAFTITVAQNASLKVSYVGFAPQVVKPTGSSITIRLQEDTKALDDVVVIGYGVQKKSDLTGAVSSVKEADLMNRSTTDAASALQGKVAGVQILNTSGAPGESAQIRVRGYSSNSGDLSPLLIVDGLKVDNIQYLDPSMIESMEVLKDAASAAIYGAEAGNGVVLITTKKGKTGHSSITYNAKFINQSLGKKAELFDGPGYVDYQKYIGKLTDEILADRGYKEGMDYNWFDQVFEPSWAQQHSLTFQGGNEQGHFLAAVNYVHNNGIVKGDKDTYNRLTAQINADYQIKPWLKIGTNNSIENWKTKSISQRGFGSSLNSVMSIDPLTPDYYKTFEETPYYFQQHYNFDASQAPLAPNGQFYGTSLYFQDATGSPLFQRDRTDATNEGWSLRGSAFLDFTPFKGFVFTSRLGYRINHSNSHSYAGPYWLTPMTSSVNYDLQAGANTGYYYQWENFANYNTTIAEKHNLGVMAGMSWIERHTDNMSIGANGTNILKGYSENYRYASYLLDDVKKSVSNAPGETKSLAYYGRLSYNYDNKYFFQANFRADAYDSSKLNADNRWGYFPSFSAGWTVSNEKFFQDNINQDYFNFLKIRASWGRNGNINVLRDYQYTTNVVLNGQWYQYNDAGNQTYGTAPEDKLANPDLTWETSEQIDLGLDARFFNNRLSLGIDYFYKTTKDLLLQYTPAPEVGFKSSYMNAGEVMNKGLEIELGWRDRIGELVYSVDVNGSFLKNEVKKLNNLVPYIEGTGGGVSGLNYKVRTRFEEGQPIWYFRGFDYVGVNKETGAPIYTNQAGEEVSTVQDGDLKYIGSAIPTFTYGLTINLAYKGFDFSVFGTGAAGAHIFSLLYSADRLEGNTLKTFYNNSWKQAGDNATYPDLKKVASDWYFWSSSASLFSADYFKFKQIQLGYTLPKALTQKAFIDNVRVFVSLDDFFTITKYPGCDPETALGYGSAGLQDSGYDSGVYPTSKKVVLGLSVTF